MQEKLQTRAFGIVAASLPEGERPLVAARALVGKFGASRIGTLARNSAVAVTAGAAGVAVASAGGKQFVVVTDRRVIFLNQTFMGGPGRTVIGALARDQVSLAEAKFGTISVLRLAFDGGEGVSLTFPRIDKKNAEQLAAALTPAG
ncbi:hypothetical protein ODJ79_22480 [Actinoplanes sp. KI2]|uniref:hypothetical protein n=1 Tax=Actinoplanes sp. KI2 TaxID=2983315 RepID=UPI0021D5F4A4|nr:hypothetical protein [Actinoplanes sp. KI2]MCU7726507.1 hypothetical protein [Actinoplanes sp. KI2]